MLTDEQIDAIVESHLGEYFAGGKEYRNLARAIIGAHELARGMMIPDGWRFYTADFSAIRAGNVTLVRTVDDDVDKAIAWHISLGEVKEKIPLFVYGYGLNFDKAMHAACSAAADAPSVDHLPKC